MKFTSQEISKPVILHQSLPSPGLLLNPISSYGPLGVSSEPEGGEFLLSS